MPDNGGFNPTTWVMGIVGTVVAGLALGLVTNWFGLSGGSSSPTTPPTPTTRQSITHIIAFNQNVVAQIGVVPTASVTVQNEGDATAENCQVTWMPGILNHGTDEVDVSPQFGLSPGERQTATFTSKVAYGEATTYTATASVYCAGMTVTPKQTKSVIVTA